MDGDTTNFRWMTLKMQSRATHLIASLLCMMLVEKHADIKDASSKTKKDDTELGTDTMGTTPKDSISSGAIDNLLPAS